MIDQYILSEPERPSDYDRKDKRETLSESRLQKERERETVASANDRHKESSELLKSLPPTESACQTNLSQLMVIS